MKMAAATSIASAASVAPSPVGIATSVALGGGVAGEGCCFSLPSRRLDTRLDVLVLNSSCKSCEGSGSGPLRGGRRREDSSISSRRGAAAAECTAGTSRRWRLSPDIGSRRFSASRGLRSVTPWRPTLAQLKLDPPQGRGTGEESPNGRMNIPTSFVESLEKQMEVQDAGIVGSSSGDGAISAPPDERGGGGAVRSVPSSSSSYSSSSVSSTSSSSSLSSPWGQPEGGNGVASGRVQQQGKVKATANDSAAVSVEKSMSGSGSRPDQVVNGHVVEQEKKGRPASSSSSSSSARGASSGAGNGALAAGAASSTSSSKTKLVVASATTAAEKKMKAGDKKGSSPSLSKVESISKEDPWFKKAQDQKLKVSVSPGGRWNRFKTYSTIQRTFEIWSFVVKFAVKWWLNQKKFMYRGGMTPEKQKDRRKALAKWLKEGLLRLGPTFIKLGQQFSTRVDVLAQEYVDELAELQDQVPPFETERAIQIVESELGGKVDEIFEQFDSEPIAAASLGQVHRACLNGKEVVVKVQRPDLKELFDIDLKNLRVLAVNLQKVDPKSDGAKRDWVAIYDECAEVLYQEINYRQEAENAERFRKNFSKLDYVKVPSIFWDYTTPKILTMEYVPGIKINRIAALDELGVDRERLGRLAVESYLEQILRHGFFHADPHPGNIAVDDVGGGRLIFYDFGMMGVINPGIREGLLEAFYGVYEKDADKVLAAMVQMGVLVPTGDMVSVRRTAEFFLNSFEERLAAQKADKEEAERLEKELGFKKELSKEEKMEKKKQRLAAIGEDLLSIAVDQPFRFPATFTFVVRAFSGL
ncbi:hypothetical protein CBR_g4041 [Chara braunii]|uniref:ABC1 atypical kinase-like domain-containing protein n=1 Tax=Chara braunii TaxID=69332 RepID=A0A388KH75_CHABU|nr:hypothetical protein CBR_g4041 [Chara braunii]|eukprot:GBG69347.1 hypothetical protein CBR_g4041 [Chara braunii]